ncbi:MAG: lipid II:glycine glycyltransferase FemX [Geminicoccaceae bacterium]
MRSVFEAAFEDLAFPVLQQSWAYGEALRQEGRTVSRYLLQDEQGVRGLVSVSERRWFGLFSASVALGGPLWLEPRPSLADRASWLSRLSHLFPPKPLHLHLWLPADHDSGDTNGVMAMIGAKQLMTGYATAWLDLRAEPDALFAGLHGKWRNMLRRALEEPLGVSQDMFWLGWLLDRHDQRQREVGFRAQPRSFVERLIRLETTAPLILVALLDQKPIAGMLFLRHGPAATYHLSWTSDEGRRRRAHHRLMWEAILRLRASGARALDLGGLNTDRSPGIARFKRGTGARCVIYPGAFA